MNTVITKRLKYEDLFTDKPLPVTEYLSGISKDDSSKLLSLLINSAHPSHRNNNAIELVHGWFSDENQTIKNEILGKITENDSIINITSSLKIAETLLNGQLNEKKSISDKDLEINIFKAYLLLNSEQDLIEEEGHKSLPEKEKSEERLIALILSMNFHDFDLTHYDIFEVLISQIIKSVEFFNYLESRNDLAEHLEVFLKMFECVSWKEWLKQYLALVLPTLDSESNSASFYEFVVPRDDNFAKNCLFLDTFCLNEESNYNQPDYIALRSNPLVKVDEGKYRITNKLFLVEKIFKSIQFLFSLVINKKVSDKNKIKDFRANHCDKFSEQTLLYNILNKSFPKKWIKASGKDFKDKGYTDSEPDYYARFKNKIFIFESKDVILKGNEKQSRNSRTLFQALSDKFYQIINKEGKVEKKAILQLIENIKRFLDKEYTNIDSSYESDNIKIYPILITHDRQFDSLGVNNILKKWFGEEVQKIKSNYKIENIKPLTVINIDMFLLYMDTFRERSSIRVEELIDNYHDKLNKKHNPFLSFSSFSANFLNKTNGLKKSINTVMQYAQQLFK